MRILQEFIDQNSDSIEKIKRYLETSSNIDVIDIFVHNQCNEPEDSPVRNAIRNLCPNRRIPTKNEIKNGLLVDLVTTDVDKLDKLVEIRHVVTKATILYCRWFNDISFRERNHELLSECIKLFSNYCNLCQSDESFNLSHLDHLDNTRTVFTHFSGKINDTINMNTPNFTAQQAQFLNDSISSLFNSGEYENFFYPTLTQNSPEVTTTPILSMELYPEQLSSASPPSQDQMQNFDNIKLTLIFLVATTLFINQPDIKKNISELLVKAISSACVASIVILIIVSAILSYISSSREQPKIETNQQTP
ncbi:MAG: hypothetical protein LBJ93_02485 [Clostridiales bacterium]|jgi:hypothetical protein|nr:hypothetical protein [Clostridiales bacterium]